MWEWILRVLKQGGQNIKMDQTEVIIQVHLQEMMDLMLEVALKISLLISGLKLRLTDGLNSVMLVHNIEIHSKCWMRQDYGNGFIICKLHTLLPHFRSISREVLGDICFIKGRNCHVLVTRAFSIFEKHYGGFLCIHEMQLLDVLPDFHGDSGELMVKEQLLVLETKQTQSLQWAGATNR